MQSKIVKNELRRLIAASDYRRLLDMSASFHGHYCPYLALGVKAGLLALKELGAEASLGYEELNAIVEINSCFTDGIQFVTGCTFGNNGLVYQDLGKTAVTLIRRNNGSAVRVYVKDRSRLAGLREKINSADAKQALDELASSVSPDQNKLSALLELYRERTLEVFGIPDEELFKVEHLKLEPPAYAPMKASLTCAECGEEVMEAKALDVYGQTLCKACAGQGYLQVDGSGIGVSE